jgi:predicted ArsR family transcriptional regulator
VTGSAPSPPVEGCSRRAQAALFADGIVADLSGRTPSRLVALLAARVAVSAQDAAEAGGLSVSAAARNLALLAERGLGREITGKGPFRMWTARL